MDILRIDQNDRSYLMTIIEKYKGGPVGIDTIAASMSEDTGTLEDAIEPYLLMNGLIQRTSRGRVATELAYEQLGLEQEGQQRLKL